MAPTSRTRKFADTSIIEAYTAITANGYAFPFGIYDDDMPVGFLMIGFDKDDYWEDAPAIAAGSYNFWRLMIDKKYQGRGYGREAVRLALEFIKTFPWAKRSSAGFPMSPKMKLPAACMLPMDLRKQERWTGKR